MADLNRAAESALEVSNEIAVYARCARQPGSAHLRGDNQPGQSQRGFPPFAYTVHVMFESFADCPGNGKRLGGSTCSMDRAQHPAPTRALRKMD